MIRSIITFVVGAVAGAAMLKLWLAVEHAGQRSDEDQISTISETGTSKTPGAKTSATGKPSKATTNSHQSLLAQEYLTAATRENFGEGGPKLADFHKIVEHPPSLARRLAFSNLLAQVGLEELKQMVNDIGPLASKFDLHQEHEMLWERYAEMDGKGACERTYASDKRFDQTSISTRCIKAWAQRDPAAASAWLQTQEEWPLRAGMTLGLIEGMAAVDPAMTHDYVDTQLTDSYQRSQGFWHVARSHLVAEGLSGVEAYFSKFNKQQPDYQAMGSTVADIFFDAGPNDGFAWYGRLGNEEQATFGRQMIDRFTQSHPDGLISYLASNGPISGISETEMARITSRAVQEWTRGEPNVMGEWLRTHQGNAHYDLVARPFIDAIEGQDPAAAKVWRETLKHTP